MIWKIRFLLFEDNLDLKENIKELLELNGFPVQAYSSKDLVKSSFTKNQIAICSTSKCMQPIDRLIGSLKKKVGGIIVLCADVLDPKIREADEKILLPFEEDELVQILRNYPIHIKTSIFRKDTIRSIA